MFRRFMIVCWTLFAASAVMFAIGNLGSEYNGRKMFDFCTRQMEADYGCWPTDFKNIIDDLEDERVNRNRDPFLIEQNTFEDLFSPLPQIRIAPDYRSLTDKELTNKIDELRKRRFNADPYFQKFELFYQIASIAKTIAATFLLWNVLLHAIAWVVAGRKASQ